jgi:hypothetical protein
MPWSINGREIFAELPDTFPMETDKILDWAEEQDEIPETIMADLRRNMPQRTWPDSETFTSEVQNYTWTMPDGSRTPVWGGVTQAGVQM